jgi:hypothetical protein
MTTYIARPNPSNAGTEHVGMGTEPVALAKREAQQ